MVKPTGGRGNKAPYETTHLRVPVPIKSEVEALIDNYRNNLLTGKECDTIEKSLTSLEEAKEVAKKIVKSKKSAKESMARLLSAVYKTIVTLDDLTV